MLDRPSFSAIAKFEDVMYFVDSKAKKFSLHMYLDELDQTSVKIQGVRGKINMNCHNGRFDN